MMTVMVISYLITWGQIVYSLITTKSDVELWDEEVE